MKDLVFIQSEMRLPPLYTRVVIPSAVSSELQRSGTPEFVRRWVTLPPVWVGVQQPQQTLCGLDGRPAPTQTGHIDQPHRVIEAMDQHAITDAELIYRRRRRQTGCLWRTRVHRQPFEATEEDHLEVVGQGAETTMRLGRQLDLIRHGYDVR